MASRNSYGILPNQSKYVHDLLQEIECQQLKAVDTQLKSSSKLDPKVGVSLKDKGKYRRIYHTVTRPDISFAVSVVSQFMQDPRIPHWQAVVRILKYLKDSPNRSLFYMKSKQMLDVNCYVDSDWAGSTYDRKSTSGYCITLGENLVIWKSKNSRWLHNLAQRQNIVPWLNL